VDWHTALRKIVNREDHVGPVRLELLRAIDPVACYMAKNDRNDSALADDAMRSFLRGSVPGFDLGRSRRKGAHMAPPSYSPKSAV
jgi:hypothetical protein